MEEQLSQQEQLFKHQTIDPAALAGAAIAAALAVFSAPGPFVPINGVVGLTLLIILLAYELKRYRHKWQNLAFGAVCALCALLVVGFVAEFYQGGWDRYYWIPLEKEPRSSRVDYWFMFACWIILTGGFTYLGSKYKIPIPQPASSVTQTETKVLENSEG